MKVVILSLACALAAQMSFADQVTLKNGDRVTGAIVKKDGNNLTIKSDLMGTVTIPWDQVTDIKSDKPLSVVLAGQTAATATAQKTKKPEVIQATIGESNGQITLSTPQGTPQSVAPATISTIRDTAEETAYERLLNPGLLQLWTGTVTVGLAGTAGNAVTSSFTTAATATRTTTHDTSSIYFIAVKSSATV